ncbi:uncharacterized protein LOC18448936 isoform X2 [Amborella trichopoda]|uniref:uncharacterized protein LOC18448936 isoform X2 n=1 Tax=Amborella trichopoda TaxID=13333 RepID=UPI0009BE33A9|nr:uncharacterized protein LOC18448936 isoform X2 [Amborella trichopoda]|eukprot:XP_020532065.1 uncharacterized protein LOC18448936 isoform X2 [Amborella trichopoda]
MEFVDKELLLAAASDFASYPGPPADASTKEFLDRFPLPVIFSVLQEPDTTGLESTLVSCLERVFKTSYGTSLIPQYMPYVKAGLQANSEAVKCLACKAVASLLDTDDRDVGTAVQLVVAYDIYPLLVNCLIHGYEQVAKASTEAIKNLARSPQGLDIMFPTKEGLALSLKDLAARSSSLARIRILALIAKLFSISSSVAVAVYESGLLNVLEAEVKNTSDVLMTLSALEVLYELAASPYSSESLLKTSLLQLLISMISNSSAESILRSRAILICARLLSSNEIFSLIGESTIRGAELLFSSSPPVARHAVEAAFCRQGPGKQLAGLHALANICGATRSEDGKMLNYHSEECLRQLIYETAAKTTKITPSGLVLSILQQDAEVRLAAYRLIGGLVARKWCLLEVCSREETVNLVTDAHAETTKSGMEARHSCCVAIGFALANSDNQKIQSNTALITKVQEAIRRGPYLTQQRVEAQPVVMTAERF